MSRSGAAGEPGKRLSLLERQQALLESQGFSKPASRAPPQSQSSRGSPAAAAGQSSSRSAQKDFFARQERHLTKQGAHNATAAGRRRAEMPTAAGIDEAGWDETSSVASHITTGSIHPSLAGSVVSLACSETTIGAGDDTAYWDFQHRVVTAKDLGHTCRECRQPFRSIGDPLTERRGARTSSRYHAECFSGFADPRSQAQSSHHVGHLRGSQIDAAPALKATSKMRTGSHFDGGGMGGKHGGAMSMGSHGFGARSSKGSVAPIPAPGPGGFTAAELEAHRAAAGAGGGAGAKADAMADFLRGAAEVSTTAADNGGGVPEPEPQ